MIGKGKKLTRVRDNHLLSASPLLPNIHILPELIVFVDKPLTKKAVFSRISKLLVNTTNIGKKSLDQKTLLTALLKREEEVSTYLGNGVALPHITLPYLADEHHAILAVLKFATSIKWKNETSSKNVDMVWGLVSSELHHLNNLKILSRIIGDSKKLNALRASTTALDFFKVLKKTEGTTGKQSVKTKGTSALWTKHIKEVKEQTKVYETSFTLPPHWQLHARPVTTFVQYVRKLLLPSLTLWIKCGKKLSPANSVVEVLSLGIGHGEKISFLMTTKKTKTRYAEDVENTSATPTVAVIASRIIKQLEALLVEEAISELHYLQHSQTITFSRNSTTTQPNEVIAVTVAIKNHLSYQKLLTNLSNRYLPNNHLELELHDFSSFTPNPARPLQLTTALMYKGYNDSNTTAGFTKVNEIFTEADFIQNLKLVDKAILKTKTAIALEQKTLAQESIKNQAILLTHYELLNDQNLIEEVKSFYYSHLTGPKNQVANDLDDLKRKPQKNIIKFNNALPPIMQIWEQVIKRKIKNFETNPSATFKARVDDWRDIELRVSRSLWELIEQEQAEPSNKSTAPSSTASDLARFLNDSIPQSPVKKKSLKATATSTQAPSYTYVFIARELLPSDIVDLSPFIKSGLIQTVIFKNLNPHSHVAIMLANYQVAVYVFKEPTMFEKMFVDFPAIELVEPIETTPINSIINTITPSITVFDGLVTGSETTIHNALEKYNQEIYKITSNITNIKQPIYRKPTTTKKSSWSPLIMVNINNEHDVKLLQKIISEQSKNKKSEKTGVGLLRTELYFGHLQKTPTMNEQIIVYRRIAALCYPAPVVVRTIDIASDKTIPFLKIIPDKHNYGHFFANTKRIKYFNDTERGFVQEQIVALSTVAREFNNLQVLFPMVVNRQDCFDYFKLLGEHRSQLKCGVMIEVPSLIYELPLINNYVDFYSIGTNDLNKFLTFEPREEHTYDEPKDFMSLFLALEHISRLTYNTKTSPNHKPIPVTLCGNHATNPNLLDQFLELGIHRFSVPLSVYRQLEQSKILTENFSAKKLSRHKPSHLKGLRDYLFNQK